jgi:hypothetical protein
VDEFTLYFDGENESVPVRFRFDWDRLEAQLILAGHPEDDLGYELTDEEKDRLAMLAQRYGIDPRTYISARRV